MTVPQKKLASNLLFGVGVLVLVIGLVLTAFVVTLGFLLFAIGAVACLAGIVVGFMPAREL